MGKADRLKWFIEIMKSKMLKHKDEEPIDLSYQELFDWLISEVNELKEALQFESRENIIKECADVANIAYFIARKIIKEGLRR